MKLLAIIVRAGYQEMNNIRRRSVPFKDKLKSFCIIYLYAVHVKNCGWLVVVAQWSNHRQLTCKLGVRLPATTSIHLSPFPLIHEPSMNHIVLNAS